jgi:hypothetical protein
VVEGSAPSPSIPSFRAAWSPRSCSLFMFQCGWTDRQSKLLPQSEKPSPVFRHAKSMKTNRTELCLAPLGFCLSLSLSLSHRKASLPLTSPSFTNHLRLPLLYSVSQPLFHFHRLHCLLGPPSWDPDPNLGPCHPAAVRYCTRSPS